RLAEAVHAQLRFLPRMNQSPVVLKLLIRAIVQGAGAHAPHRNRVPMLLGRRRRRLLAAASANQQPQEAEDRQPAGAGSRRPPKFIDHVREWHKRASLRLRARALGKAVYHEALPATDARTSKASRLIPEFWRIRLPARKTPPACFRILLRRW